MLNRVRHSIRTLTATSGRWCCQSVVLAAIVPAISKADSYAVLAVVALAVVLVAIVALAAVFSAKPSRRKAAREVLDRLLRWRA